MQENEPQLRYGSQENEKKDGKGEDFEAFMTILPPEKVEIKRNLKAMNKKDNVLAKVTNKARRPVDGLEQPQEAVLEKDNKSDQEEEKLECKYSSSFSDEQDDQKADVDPSKENIQNNPDDYTLSEVDEKG